MLIVLLAVVFSSIIIYLYTKIKMLQINKCEKYLTEIGMTKEQAGKYILSGLNNQDKSGVLDASGW